MIAVGKCCGCRAVIGGPSEDPTRQAKPGDFAICVYCSTVMMVAEAGGLRALTPIESHALPVNVRLASDAVALRIRSRARGALA